MCSGHIFKFWLQTQTDTFFTHMNIHNAPILYVYIVFITWNQNNTKMAPQHASVFAIATSILATDLFYCFSTGTFSQFSVAAGNFPAVSLRWPRHFHLHNPTQTLRQPNNNKDEMWQPYILKVVHNGCFFYRENVITWWNDI